MAWIKTLALGLGILTVFSLTCAAREGGGEGPDLTRLIRDLKPSVVAVGTYYFNDTPKTSYLGTGFVIGEGDRIITNSHVVAPLVKADKLARMRIFHRDLPVKGIRVTIAAQDEFHDLAVLEQNSVKLSSLSLEHDLNGVQEGVEVAFTGYPIGLVLGLNPTTHRGIISNIAPLVKPSPSSRIMDGTLIRHLDRPYDVYQIDAVAYPGNSGSPVYRTSDGRVIGVINQVFVRGLKENVLSHPSGITYAIPIQYALELNKGIK
ncbi:S1 family peptidase [Desulfospira joergensenii]|uniref:S1 family peptidase n=1 Tax=Desulfospira joergensenii TaxID=53329 RepID=UPI000526387C|nr:serine protease [Desulfospira joergensenii]